MIFYHYSCHDNQFKNLYAALYLKESEENNLESSLVKSLCLNYEPVAVLLSNEKPEGALQGKEGQRSCTYYRPGFENVMIPFSSGCQSLFLLPYAESKKENPRAVVGLIDITVRPMVEADMLSFSVPFKMFLDMEENAEGSFLEKDLWHRVMARMKKSK